MSDLILLSVAEMGRADRAAIEGGVPGERLMEAAGRGVADAIVERWAPCPVVVLAGPGNNGGDGFVAARHLKAAGWPVRVALFGAVERLKGDAALNAGRWDGPLEPLSPGSLDGAALVVDALFGAGLARPLDGVPRAVVEALGERGSPVVAVDVPSGVDGDSGEIRGAAPEARLTVTFFRRKPGHLLLPGRVLCGEVLVVDIGIPDSVLDEIRPRTRENGPSLWASRFPWPGPLDHKYRRGHTLVVGGAEMTGAGRLAARAALRIGAGLVTVAAPAEALAIYAASMAGLLTEPLGAPEDFGAVLERRRKTAYLIGPGNGVSGDTRDRALAALATGRPTVLDADALTVFEDDPPRLFEAIRGPVVLTPHEGEFRRIFPDLSPADGRLARARAAAERAGAVVVFKGGDTVVAAPDGMAAINTNAPPELARAGTGDVLAGMTVGLLAQGMAPFDAARAAVWLHGEAARLFGPGLIAEDLPEQLPRVLSSLKRNEFEIRP